MFVWETLQMDLEEIGFLKCFLIFFSCILDHFTLPLYLTPLPNMLRPIHILRWLGTRFFIYLLRILYNLQKAFHSFLSISNLYIPIIIIIVLMYLQLAIRHGSPHLPLSCISALQSLHANLLRKNFVCLSYENCGSFSRFPTWTEFKDIYTVLWVMNYFQRKNSRRNIASF